MKAIFLWYKRTMSEKEQSKVRSVILDSISEGVSTVDLNWRINVMTTGEKLA